MISKLLVVIGCLDDQRLVKQVVKTVGIGIERWIEHSPKEEQIELIKLLNSIPSLKSIPNRNSKNCTVVSRYAGRILDTIILINPTSRSLSEELVDLFLSSPTRCLVNFGGLVMEDNADWLLQDGPFSISRFKEIFSDSKVSDVLSKHNTQVTISCCKLGSWKTALDRGELDLNSKISLEILNSHSLPLHVSDKISEGKRSNDTSEQKQSSIECLTSFLEDGILNEIPGIFGLLEPPQREVFVKVRKPCLYVFPGCNGDSAFFAIDGFNMLVNGGACCKPSFWKLIQHVDRVDGILATHLGSDNLPGLNSLLRRKLEERKLKLPMDKATPEYQDLQSRLISPNLGLLFMNAPAKFLEEIRAKESASDLQNTKRGARYAAPPRDGNVSCQLKVKTVDVVTDLLMHSMALNMEIVPLVRKVRVNEPIALFSKVGLGRLDMHVLSPAEGSKELSYINEKWGRSGKTTTATGKTGVTDTSGNGFDSLVTNLSSICILLVWHPSKSNEKITRVLFTGNVSQTALFEGLETIRNLPFMKMQFVTKDVLDKQKQTVKPNELRSAQKAPRSYSGSYVAKEPVTTGPRKAASASSNPLRKASIDKVNNGQKPKLDRAARARPVSAFKEPTAKDRLTARSTRADSAAQKAMAKPPVAKKRSTSFLSSATVPSPRPDLKRGSPALPRPPVVNLKKNSSLKVTGTSKNLQNFSLSKKKADVLKSATRSTPRPALRKPAAKPPIEKRVKNFTISAALAATTAPVKDLTVRLTKCSPDSVKNGNVTGLPSSNSDRRTATSALSDLHMPEGEDCGSMAEYVDSPSLSKSMNKLGFSTVDEADKALERKRIGMYTLIEPEISEDSDMISTNGSSLPAHLQTPVDDNFMTACPYRSREDEFLSSDRSTPSQNDQQCTVEIFTKSEDDVTMSIHRADEHLPTFLHPRQDSFSVSETAPASDAEEGFGADNNDQTVFDNAAAVVMKEMMPELEQELAFASSLRPSIQEAAIAQSTDDDNSSSNSSVEGSYDLHLAGGSTFTKESITDFKYHQPPLDQAFKDAGTCVDGQPRRTELREEHTMPMKVSDLTEEERDLMKQRDYIVAVAVEDGDDLHVVDSAKQDMKNRRTILRRNEDREPTFKLLASSAEGQPSEDAGLDTLQMHVKNKASKSGAILKTEHCLAPAEENFSLHGETNLTESFAVGIDEDDPFEENGSHQHDDIWLRQGMMEVPAGLGQLKAPAELDSPLDANAKPFIPKGSSSTPVGQTQSYAARTHFEQGDAAVGYEMYDAAPSSATSVGNPFLMDLMENSQLETVNPIGAILPPVRSPDPCAAQDQITKGAVKKIGRAASAVRRSAATSWPVYVDLAYVPNHGNKNSVCVEFFRTIRAKYYVISGDDQSRDEPSIEVLSHLLEGIKTWHVEAGRSNDKNDSNVTIVPTCNTRAVQDWFAQNSEELELWNIHVATIGSDIMESIENCKIEF